jgi:hypothetical protein
MSAASRRVYVELRRDWIGMLPELSGSDDWMALRANGSVASDDALPGTFFCG